MFNLLHKDGDTCIQLVETQPGVYAVTLHEGSQPIIEFTKTTHLSTALDRYEQAVRDENDQYRSDAEYRAASIAPSAAHTAQLLSDWAKRHA